MKNLVLYAMTSIVRLLQQSQYGDKIDRYTLSSDFVRSLTVLIRENNSRKAYIKLKEYDKQVVSLNKSEKNTSDFFQNGMYDILLDIIFNFTSSDWDKCRNRAIRINLFYLSLGFFNDLLCSDYNITSFFTLLPYPSIFSLTNILLTNQLHNKSTLYLLPDSVEIKNILGSLTFFEIARLMPVIQCLLDGKSSQVDQNAKVLFSSGVLEKLLKVFSLGNISFIVIKSLQQRSLKENEPIVETIINLSNIQASLFPSISFFFNSPADDISFCVEALTELFFIMFTFLNSFLCEQIVDFLLVQSFDQLLINIYQQFKFSELPPFTSNSSHPIVRLFDHFSRFLSGMNFYRSNLMFTKHERSGKFHVSEKGLGRWIIKDLTMDVTPKSYSNVLLSITESICRDIPLPLQTRVGCKLGVINYCLKIITTPSSTVENETNRQKAYDLLASLIKNNPTNIAFVLEKNEILDILRKAIQEPFNSSVFLRYLMINEHCFKEIKIQIKENIHIVLFNIAKLFVRNELSSSNICCLNTAMIAFILYSSEVPSIIDKMKMYDTTQYFDNKIDETLKTLAAMWEDYYKDNTTSFEKLIQATEIPKEQWLDTVQHINQL